MNENAETEEVKEARKITSTAEDEFTKGRKGIKEVKG